MDEDDLVAVARAYRRARVAGQMDHGAGQAATAALLLRHPDMAEEELARAAAVLTRDAANRWSDWFYGRDRARMERRTRNVRMVTEVLQRRLQPDFPEAAAAAEQLANGLVDDMAAAGLELFSEEDLDELDDTPKLPADRS